MIERVHYRERIDSAMQIVPIVVLIGARQVGKTSIMKLYAEQYTANTLFLNGQDAEIAERFTKFSILEQYLQVYLNKDLDGLLLVDEFQFIPNVSTMLKLLTDKYDKLHIICSGSSSLDIRQRVEESLAGRVRIIEVYSLSFEEYLLFKDDKLHVLYTQSQPDADVALLAPLQHVWQEYLVYGGLPRAALTNSPEEKAEILNDIYQTYLLKDVRSYIANEHFVGFNKLLRLLATQIGNLVNVNELSREAGLPYQRCEEYIYLLEKMYIIRLVEPFYTNKRKTIGKMNKVYFCDLGLRNIIYNSFNEIAFRTDNGALFENYVLMELLRGCRANDTLQFYRTQTGTEVDFVLNGATKRIAIECKYKRFEKPIKIPALTNFANEETIDKRYIININLSAGANDLLFLPGIYAQRVMN